MVSLGHLPGQNLTLFIQGNMKKTGIILCGGKGTRMLPATEVMNKHLIPLLNVPMVVYPLTTLKEMGIMDILIVSGGNHIGDIANLLGDGSSYGVSLTYRVQKEAGGIAQALALASDFIEGQFAVILGDNYFASAPEFPVFGCGLVTKVVEDPRRFGVYDKEKNSIIEKPKDIISNEAVTGLYFYTPEIFKFIETLAPSARGEMEITDVNNWCLKNLDTEIVHYTNFWSDMGTPESMLATINHIYGKSGQ